MKCALCKNKECYTDGKDCLAGDVDAVAAMDENDRRIWRVAGEVEATFYKKKTRLEEIVEFAKRMGYGKLGLAFCIGLSREAEIIHRFFAAEFEVVSVCCKLCGIDKDDHDMPHIRPGQRETACNPVGQALVFNREKVDLVVICGLCVGHDALLSKHAAAPVTTLAAKDRVLAHNPLGAVYSHYHHGG
ncbi:MAG: DUF1847 domain-containing protein [Candidatus Lernaella stagnicola]|nr:DUF1847 domain-containing protein [Candidatus Lernaella stagnicola]